jgi:hypothetical protein
VNPLGKGDKAISAWTTKNGHPEQDGPAAHARRFVSLPEFYYVSAVEIDDGAIAKNVLCYDFHSTF